MATNKQIVCHAFLSLIPLIFFVVMKSLVKKADTYLSSDDAS